MRHLGLARDTFKVEGTVQVKRKRRVHNARNRSLSEVACRMMSNSGIFCPNKACKQRVRVETVGWGGSNGDVLEGCPMTRQS